MGKKSWKIFKIALYSIVIIGIAFYWLVDFHFISSDNNNSVNILNENDTSLRKWNNIKSKYQASKSELNTYKNSYDSIVFGMDYPTGGYSSLLGVLNTSKQSLLLLPWITLRKTDVFSTFSDYRIIVKNNSCYLSTKENNSHLEIYTPSKKVGFFVNPNNYLNEYSPNDLDYLDIYIPIKNKISYFILAILNSFWMVGMIVSGMFILRWSCLFLLNISNKKAFGWDNVQRLKYCIWLILGLILFQYIVMLCLYLGFYNILHGYVQMKSWMELINWKLWIMLIIYFSLFLAFFRGNKLQTDQEYTI